MGIFRLIVWLGKRQWGLAFLLAFATLIGAIMWEDRLRSYALFDNPIFRVGFRVGTLVFPDYRTPHTTGWYYVPLFGLGADFIALLL